MNSKEKTELFLSIIQANKGIIYKVANTYCKDMEDRKDLVQEISIQLWKSFDNYSSQYKYSTWMYRIALNVAISFYRKENRRRDASNPLSEGILDFADSAVEVELEEVLAF
ncbi:RNA polymerase sigma factor [Solitalea canadensis]|uniref:RNA polymerase sigma factor n=1 Tax=Solitalea canadensis TaxID=995 RepID=UPI0002473811|nr:sigma-70 family RNA polymerase sigma factor [Solitalea canadensis]